jgi:hypothetical protein
MGRQRKLHSEELHNLFSFQNVITVIKSRKMIWVGYVARMGEMRNAYKILYQNLKGRRQVGRPRGRQEGNIKTDFKGLYFDDVRCIHLAQDRDQWRALVNTVMNLQVP